jgi:hypothetical protein
MGPISQRLNKLFIEKYNFYFKSREFNRFWLFFVSGPESRCVESPTLEIALLIYLPILASKFFAICSRGIYNRYTEADWGEL